MLPRGCSVVVFRGPLLIVLLLGVFMLLMTGVNRYTDHQNEYNPYNDRQLRLLIAERRQRIDRLREASTMVSLTSKGSSTVFHEAIESLRKTQRQIRLFSTQTRRDMRQLAENTDSTASSSNFDRDPQIYFSRRGVQKLAGVNDTRTRILLPRLTRPRHCNMTTIASDSGQRFVDPRDAAVEGEAGVDWRILEYSTTEHTRKDSGGVDASSDTATIFISIASFRDVHCPACVSEIFEHARFPRRVFLGIAEQRDATETNYSCLPEAYRRRSGCDGAEWCPRDNIRVRYITAAASKGPTHGRYLSMLLYQGESYVMVIDSHSRFRPGYDVAVLREYWSLPTLGVLSHYPPAVADFKVRYNWAQRVLTHMCSAHYLNSPQTSGLLRMDGRDLPLKGNAPRLQPYTAAGFIFGDAAIFSLLVPFDPHLDYIFDGEEMLFTARLWTSGVDSYCPSKALLAHTYGRPEAPRVWSVPNNLWWKHQADSHVRFHAFMKTVTKNTQNERMASIAQLKKAGKLSGLLKYGMGRRRSVESFYEFARINRTAWTVSDEWCGRALTTPAAIYAAIDAFPLQDTTWSMVGC